jgi:hypothetical protein
MGGLSVAVPSHSAGSSTASFAGLPLSPPKSSVSLSAVAAAGSGNGVAVSMGGGIALGAPLGSSQYHHQQHHVFPSASMASNVDAIAAASAADRAGVASRTSRASSDPPEPVFNATDNASVVSIVHSQSGDEGISRSNAGPATASRAGMAYSAKSLAPYAPTNYQSYTPCCFTCPVQKILTLSLDECVALTHEQAVSALRNTINQQLGVINGEAAIFVSKVSAICVLSHVRNFVCVVCVCVCVCVITIGKLSW